MDNITVRFRNKEVPHLYVENTKGLSVQDGTVAFYTSTEVSRKDYLFPMDAIMYVTVHEENQDGS